MENDKFDFQAMQEIFKEDLTRCIKNLHKTGHPHEWRTFIRTMFAHIDGTCHQFKVTTIYHYKNGAIDLSNDEVLFLLNKRAKKTDDDVIFKDTFHPTKTNIKRTLKLFQKLTGEKNLIDFSNNGWRELQDSIDIRNRMTHPKKSDDLFVKENEFDLLISANAWWLKNVNYLLSAYYKRLTRSDYDVKERFEKEYSKIITDLQEEE